MELPLIYRGMPAGERHDLARRALKVVGLEGWDHHTPGELSGGQQQRVATARAIVTRPALLLAGEPTGNLDSARSREIMDLLTGFNRDEGITIVMVTHEPDMAAYARRIAGNEDVNIIQVSVREGVSTERVQGDLERLMRTRRHISAGEDDDFSVLDMREIADMLSGTTRVLTALPGAVAAVSLLVGGIGIMNIMLVSVTERTREIGIRLAIGALEREVLLQFLVEAVTLSSLGGLIGIVLAIVASVALSGALGVPFVFNWGIVAIAFLFSAAVGVIFGYFPARKAARLDPIEPLRHE